MKTIGCYGCGRSPVFLFPFPLFTCRRAPFLFRHRFPCRNSGETADASAKGRRSRLLPRGGGGPVRTSVSPALASARRRRARALSPVTSLRQAQPGRGITSGRRGGGRQVPEQMRRRPSAGKATAAGGSRPSLRRRVAGVAAQEVGGGGGGGGDGRGGGCRTRGV